MRRHVLVATQWAPGRSGVKRVVDYGTAYSTTSYTVILCAHSASSFGTLRTFKICGPWQWTPSPSCDGAGLGFTMRARALCYVPLAARTRPPASHIHLQGCLRRRSERMSPASWVHGRPTTAIVRGAWPEWGISVRLASMAVRSEHALDRGFPPASGQYP